MLEEYLFVYCIGDGSYPARFRILREQNETEVPDLRELTGTVSRTAVENLRTELKVKYPEPTYTISRAWANTWKAIEHNHHGLDYEYD